MAEVAFVLGDLEFENAVVAERVPGKLCDRAMVLMFVVAVVAEDQVGLTELFQRFEEVFDLSTDEGQVTLAKAPDDDIRIRRAGEKVRGAAPSFFLARPRCREDDPAHLRARILGKQTQQGTAATDFDIVAMGIQTQDVHWRPPRVEGERHHGRRAALGTRPMGQIANTG